MNVSETILSDTNCVVFSSVRRITPFFLLDWQRRGCFLFLSQGGIGLFLYDSVKFLCRLYTFKKIYSNNYISNFLGKNKVTCVFFGNTPKFQIMVFVLLFSPQAGKKDTSLTNVVIVWRIYKQQ